MQIRCCTLATAVQEKGTNRLAKQHSSHKLPCVADEKWCAQSQKSPFIGRIAPQLELVHIFTRVCSEKPRRDRLLNATNHTEHTRWLASTRTHTHNEEWGAFICCGCCRGSIRIDGACEMIEFSRDKKSSVHICSDGKGMAARLPCLSSVGVASLLNQMRWSTIGEF